MEVLYKPDCIRTYTGKSVNVFNPTADMICIEDIAHALSNQCRFGGHVPEFYSVAQHSVLCTQLLPRSLELAGLLHDASEAYLMDIPSPLKKGLINYKEIEDKMMSVIAEKFGFEYPLPEKVKEVDKIVLEWEWSALMLRETHCLKIYPSNQNDSEELFLVRYNNLK